MLHYCTFFLASFSLPPLLSLLGAVGMQVLMMTLQVAYTAPAGLTMKQRWGEYNKKEDGSQLRRSTGLVLDASTCELSYWSWMPAMGNSQYKLHCNRRLMRKKLCTTARARQERGYAGREERWTSIYSKPENVVTYYFIFTFYLVSEILCEVSGSGLICELQLGNGLHYGPIHSAMLREMSNLTVEGSLIFICVCV